MQDLGTHRRLLVPQLGGLSDVGTLHFHALIRFCTGAVPVPHDMRMLFFGGATATASSNFLRG